MRAAGPGGGSRWTYQAVAEAATEGGASCASLPPWRWGRVWEGSAFRLSRQPPLLPASLRRSGPGSGPPPPGPASWWPQPCRGWHVGPQERAQERARRLGQTARCVRGGLFAVTRGGSGGPLGLAETHGLFRCLCRQCHAREGSCPHAQTFDLPV